MPWYFLSSLEPILVRLAPQNIIVVKEKGKQIARYGSRKLISTQKLENLPFMRLFPALEIPQLPSRTQKVLVLSSFEKPRRDQCR